jgi:hypothetical protein
VVEQIPSKHEALSSNSNIDKRHSLAGIVAHAYKSSTQDAEVGI